MLQGAEEVVTPLVWQQWEEELREHPDREWVEFLVMGVREGFRLGHDQSKVVLKERRGTMYEASHHRGVIHEYLENEVQCRRIWKVNAEGVQCLEFGVIPKKGRPGRWRLIVDLSAPEAHSVNDGIDRVLSSVSYTSVDDVVKRVLELGEGARLAKADVKAAYRNVPVHPRDRWLLGMRWEGETFVDGTLPFGLRSAPLLFTALGDAIEWIATKRGAVWLRHYIDDFVAVGQRGTDQCERAMAVFKWWHQFGLRWNGTSLMKAVVVDGDPQEEMFSDPSGSWGCGATWQGEWFQIQWGALPGTSEWGIMPKEMLPIVVAAVVWGARWKGRAIRARCDNMSVMAAIQAGACKERWSMHLLRCMAFVEATLSVTVRAEHIRGVENGVADDLSRDRLQSALSIMQVPKAEPVTVPVELMGMLTMASQSWSGQEWRQLSELPLTCQ